MQIYNIITSKDNRELTQHGDAGFPCAGYDPTFSEYIHGEVPWHWHEEIELLIVYEGYIRVEYLGGEQVLNIGEGIFINANMPHKMTSVDKRECKIIDFVLKPELIGGSVDSRIFREYIAPICKNSGLPIVKFSPEIPWQEDALNNMKKAFEAYTNALPGFEMKILSGLMEYWRLLYTNISPLIKTGISTSIDETRIRNILNFIQNRYMDHITVSDLSNVAGISDSECYRLFNRGLKSTPGDYLIEFRLKKASEQLINSSESVLNIAMDNGFNSSAYFTKRFKKYYGITPMGFRKNLNEKK